MALGSLPYKWKLTSRVVDAAGSGWLLGVTVTDATGSNVRLTTTVNVGRQSTWTDLVSTIEEQVARALEADAGSKAALIDAAISSGRLFNFLN